MRRWLALALLAACSEGPAAPTAQVVSMPGVPWPALDILIAMDDSPSTEHLQYALGLWSDILLDPLTEAAGTTDLHVGVTTSDMGSSGGPALGAIGNGGCAGAGQDGALITTGAPVTGNFLVDGSGTQNFTSSRHAALDTMLRVGGGGCGFEQPLAATARAFTNPANAGFERANANLLVISMQDEDDCSFTDPALIEDSPELGPLASFRCTQFGVACDEPVGSPGEKHNCHSDEDSPYLMPVRPIADALRDRKPDDSRVVFAAIAGPVEPFVVEGRAPPGGGPAIDALAHSCAWTEGASGGLAVADPAVRMRDVADELGAHGVFTSVCDSNLIGALGDIVRVAKQMYGVACLDSSKLRDTGGGAGVQPRCMTTEERDGTTTELPDCPAAGDCVEVVADPTACPETPDHLRLRVTYATPPTDTTYIRARCEIP